ncbi:arf-GAP domain and FG repeat-containing protein 2 isoform X2 [Phyllopteryx taeniolatus]|uniref:arf-GAP domain and FG repeat-containing protein 2 isoform X2 n=1 Tax=Phyllopteryx taeniolatus TaxID=161469 RepID=UPI002AD3A0B6|nr:arf-GAP domain and FG repeat-containing protein 2 isoform X2 [Phyllopteryx taeniolatus]
MSNRKHRDNQEICARKVRELARSGVNKHCFECNQPGVTYTDVAVGTFVCTSCSGMLRGLNPPHRVKSISMTTFSQQEVEFLQNHGNEVGRRTWLCAFDPKTDGCGDMKDSQKFKEFLQDKYEKKKWHFSKSKNRRDAEGPWSPGVQSVLVHGPLAGQPLHNVPAGARSARTTVSASARRLSRRVIPTRRAFHTFPSPQSQTAQWDRAAAADALAARPSRSQSFRDAPPKDQNACGIERQRPGSLSSARPPSFPALPRPSGRAASTSGSAGPFRAFPKSLSLDFGALKTPQPPLPQSLSQQQTTANAQDRYAAVSHLDSVFSETAPPAGPPQYGALFGSRLSSGATPARSPGAETLSTSQTFANFPNPFSSASQQPAALSPSNPFSSSPGEKKTVGNGPTFSQATARSSPPPLRCSRRPARFPKRPPATRKPTASPPSLCATPCPKSLGPCRSTLLQGTFTPVGARHETLSFD